MKKILIPTDFSTESLQLVEFAILNYNEVPLDIVLVHGYRMPEVYWEVLNFSAIREVRHLSTQAFHDAKLELLREHKKEIQSISIELFTGNNSLAFKNFLAQLHVSEALIPSENFLHFPNYRSFDPTYFIRKNMENIREITLEGRSRELQKPRFSVLNLFW